MATIRVKINTDSARKQIKGIRDQVPFATRITLNALARNVKEETDKQMTARLDRPKRYTLRAIHTENATASTLKSVVKVSDKVSGNSGGKTVAKTLGHLFEGGGRRGKGIEGALKGLNVLPAGKFMVPGKFAPLDTYGNIKLSYLRKVVTYFKSHRPAGINAAGLAPGVWLRHFDRRQKKARKAAGKSGSSEFFVVHKQINVNAGRKGKRQRPPEPVILFTDRPRYRQFFDMERNAISVITRDLSREFDKNYQRAIATAKPA